MKVSCAELNKLQEGQTKKRPHLDTSWPNYQKAKTRRKYLDSRKASHVEGILIKLATTDFSSETMETRSSKVT